MAAAATASGAMGGVWLGKWCVVVGAWLLMLLLVEVAAAAAGAGWLVLPVVRAFSCRNVARCFIWGWVCLLGWLVGRWEGVS